VNQTLIVAAACGVLARELHYLDLLVFLVAVIFRAYRAAFVSLGIATRLDPLRTDRRQAFGDVDLLVRIGVRAGGVIDDDRRLTRFW